jgi:hypothetical protein
MNCRKDGPSVISKDALNHKNSIPIVPHTRLCTVSVYRLSIIINQKTCLEPLRMMLPAYHAALRCAVTKSKQDLAAAKRILLHLSDYSFKFEHYDVGMNYTAWGELALNT